jgi:hypothetical protein
MCGCSADQQSKYKALIQKQQEVTAYLDGFAHMKNNMQLARGAKAAENKELLHKMANLHNMIEGHAPNKSALSEVKTALEYKQMQTKNSAETSVCFLPVWIQAVSGLRIHVCFEVVISSSSFQRSMLLHSKRLTHFQSHA